MSPKQRQKRDQRHRKPPYTSCPNSPIILKSDFFDSVTERDDVARTAGRPDTYFMQPIVTSKTPAGRHATVRWRLPNHSIKEYIE